VQLRSQKDVEDEQETKIGMLCFGRVISFNLYNQLGFLAPLLFPKAQITYVFF